MTPRIDAHQHFWRYRAEEFPWIDDSMAVVRRDRLPQDLAPELRATYVDGCVAVQARQSLDETRFLLGLGRDNPLVRGVVGWVDLCAPDVAGQLAEFADEPKFVGVRHLLQDEPDDAFMVRPEFVRGVAAVGDAGLAYDLLLFPRHLEYAVALVRELPDVRFIIDHLAKPGIAAGDLAGWEPGFRALAAEPNVACKLSGMVTEADWATWTDADFAPFLDAAFDAFGPGRLLFGSDWPVCELAASYGQVLGIVEHYIAALPTALPSREREAVMGGNALDWYKLDDSLAPSPEEYT